jgi:hypothetical protein
MWVGGQPYAQAALPPGIIRYPLYEAGWAAGPVWTDAENLAPTDIRSPDCSSHKIKITELLLWKWLAHKYYNQYQSLQSYGVRTDTHNRTIIRYTF